MSELEQAAREFLAHARLVSALGFANEFPGLTAPFNPLLHADAGLGGLASYARPCFLASYNRYAALRG